VERPTLADGLVAAGFLVAALTEVWVTGTALGPPVLGSVVALLSAVPLAWRRAAPLIAAAAAVSAILVPLVRSPAIETSGLFVTIAWLVAVHGVNAYGRPRAAALGTLAVACSAVVATLTMTAPAGQRAGNVTWVLAVVGAAAAAGQLMRHQRARLEIERLAGEAEARAAERRGLARELHDVVAHGVAVMVVQAGAAQAMVHSDPDRAAGLLDAVQRSGEQSAAELRRMLDLLGGTQPALDPQPRLQDLPGLIERLRMAGIPADLDISVPQDLAPGMEVTAYRVVQEGITNALKHGRRVAICVTVTSDREVLVVTVDDADSVATADLSRSHGRGLRGLQERVRLYGGALRAGRRGSCWRVQASLPLHWDALSPSFHVRSTEPDVL
jgi:signal transduction histidine kinase